MVKISDDTPNLNNIVKGKGIFFGESIELTKDDVLVHNFGELYSVLAYDNTPLALSLKNLDYFDEAFTETGFYVYSPAEDSYVSYIEFEEKAKTINSDYISEEIDKRVINKLFDENNRVKTISFNGIGDTI